MKNGGYTAKMKMNEFRRMLRNSRKEKDAGDMKDKSSRKQPNTNKRRAGAKGDDDESVDSHGNIRDLIAYDTDDDEDYEEEDDEYDSEGIDTDETDDTRLTPEQKNVIRKEARKAALKARQQIADDAKKQRLKSKPKPIVQELSGSKIKKRIEESKLKYKSKSKSKSKSQSKRDEEEEEEEEEEEDEEEEEEEEEEDDEEEYEEEEEMPGISINFGSFGMDSDDFAERMIPKRYNLKKESEDVRKFVKLVTKPHEENTIDDQIDQFKSLKPEKQKQMLEALDRKTPSAEENLMFKILGMKLPPDTQSMVLAKYNSLQTLDTSSGEFFKLRAWLEKLTSLPLGIYKEIPVKMEDGQESCGAFMERAKRCLEEAIYGQDEAKMQILQFIATKIANPSGKGLSLILAGPPGIGKTSLIKNGIAKALGWPFQFISLGGDSDATTYTGHQLVYESSHAGKIANSLIQAKSMSMVLMFDELDKISATPKGEEVQNLLIHLTDSVQNEEFEDKYLAGVPLDLSKVLFTFSANDLGKIDRILLDRMMVINLQGYSQKEKLAICENFLLPAALNEVNLKEKVAISKDILEHILKEYASEETGVRQLKRCVEQVAQKINMLRIFNAKELPFYIKDFQLPFVVKKEHVDLFLKKKTVNESFTHLYT